MNRATAAGRLEEVEDLAHRCEEAGLAAAQPDTDLFSRPAPALARMAQARPDEARDTFSALHAQYPDFPAVTAALGWAEADRGRLDEARDLLEALHSGGFSSIPRDYAWLITVSFLSRMCTLLADGKTAAELYDLLLPHRSEIMTSQAVWLGPAEHDLGLLATTLGRYDEADAHFSAAAEVEERIGSRAMLVHTEVEWARMLLRRRAARDVERAHELLQRARNGARDVELRGMEARIDAMLAAT
jgi:tetratricopeptide (TPR) repeat protein